MKWSYKLVLVILMLVLILSASGILFLYNRINNVYHDDMSYIFSDNPKYHFSLILKSDSDEYWQNFKEGVYEGAKAYNDVVEFHTVSTVDQENQIVEYINIASKSQLDGVIVNGENTNLYGEAINAASHESVEVVLGGVEFATTERLSYVGTNFYEYGVQAAKLISQVETDDGQVQVAVILSSDQGDGNTEALTSQNALMMSGFRSVIDDLIDVKLVDTLYRESDLLGAENLTREIITEYEDIDVIFCTNAKDTVAASRIIVERNLVGEVFVVGTDVTEEIINYLEKGIVVGVLDRNGYMAGYKSVEILHNSLEGTFQPGYVDIDTDVYTKINISSYHN
ncbi:MAG: substrate-binding domain-containing protein [Eubacteriales bacterium]